MNTRQPDQTRQTILAAAYAEIHRQGFQAASLARILADTSLTKGALYHHFPDKKALGLAVVEEVIRPELTAAMLTPVARAEHPLRALQALLEAKAQTADEALLTLGCPLNNLMQEMSPVDEDFRRQLNRLFTDWVAVVAEALARGQAAGEVRRDLDARQTAYFVVSALEGCIGMSKNTQSPAAFRGCALQLAGFLEGLKA